MNRFSIRTALFATAVIAVTLAARTYWTSLSPARRALLFSGSDIHEHRLEFVGEADFDYHLSALIDPSDFEAFAHQLGLRSVAQTEGRVSVDMNWFDCPDWWPNPLPVENAWYSWEDGDECVAAAVLHDGRLYYHELKW